MRSLVFCCLLLSGCATTGEYARSTVEGIANTTEETVAKSADTLNLIAIKQLCLGMTRGSYYRLCDGRGSLCDGMDAMCKEYRSSMRSWAR